MNLPIKMSLPSPPPPPPPPSSSKTEPFRDLTYYHQLVKLCIRTRDLHNGQRLHLRLLQSKIPITTPVLPNLFMSLYSKCSRPDLARQVFDGMLQRDIASWTTIISCFAQNNDPAQSIALFLDLLHDDSGLSPNNFTISSAMSACTALGSLQLGQQLHSLAIKNGLASDVSVGGSIAKMYGTRGSGASLDDSRKAFDMMVERNVLVWNLMISNYVENGLAKDAMDLFEQMRIEGMEPDHFTISCVMSACTALGTLQLGKQLHSLVIKNGFASNVAVSGSTANMYAMCGSIADSRKIFDRMVERNVGTWTLMITRCVENGLAKDAMDFFEQMRIEGFEPDEITITQAMPACIALGSLQLGQQLHSLTIRKGFVSDASIVNCVTDMYAKYGRRGSMGLKEGL